MNVARATFRAQPRKAVRAAVSLTDRSTGQAVTANIRNLGLGGICIEIEEPLAVGCQMIVSISTPSMWDPLELHGVVVWSEPSQLPHAAGLVFQLNSAAEVASLFEFLEQSRFSAA
jgi:Tfp pilus assembly protein PilZ